MGAASANRYEGSWKDNKKHGAGKFFYLDKGQMLKGTWLEDIPKCGMMEDFGREKAPLPTKYLIPEVRDVWHVFVVMFMLVLCSVSWLIHIKSLKRV